MKKITEYRFGDSLIIGVDHGYGNVKTRHTVTRTDVIKQDKKPAFSSNYTPYDGSYFIIGEGHKGFISDKQEDMDNYVLTLMAIAKELKLRNLASAKVHLAVGLPLKWVQAQREDFKRYLMQNRTAGFRYKGIDYSVEFTGCTVMPQCYSAVAENLRNYNGMNLLVDIGNGTMNVMYLNNGRAMESRAWTEKFGVSQCALKIRNRVLDETGTKMPDEVVENFLKTGAADVAELYAGLMKEAAAEYVAEIFQKLRDYDYNEKLMKLYFIGGGARIVEAVGTYDSERTFFNHDIKATAKGYEYFCYMKMKHSK